MIPIEVIKWLKESAYAVKGAGYWFITDFPNNQTPDSLHIPLKEKGWQAILKAIKEVESV